MFPIVKIIAAAERKSSVRYEFSFIVILLHELLVLIFFCMFTVVVQIVFQLSLTIQGVWSSLEYVR